MAQSVTRRIERNLTASVAFEPGQLIRPRSAESIKASGYVRPRRKAGHMTASDHCSSRKKLLQVGGHPHMRRPTLSPSPSEPARFVLGFIGPLPAPCRPVRTSHIQVCANRDQQSWARHRPASCESRTWGSETARSSEGNEIPARDARPSFRRERDTLSHR